VGGGSGEDKGAMAICVNAGNSDTAAETSDKSIKLKFCRRRNTEPDTVKSSGTDSNFAA
jgi:hypothetical protein